MMPKPILALCDSDKEYIQQLAQYLRRQSDLWEVRTYFGVSELRKDAEEAAFAAVSETVYGEGELTFPPGKTVILSESGLLRWEDMIYVDKYQPADVVCREFMRFYVERIAKGSVASVSRLINTKFIGFYSPIHRLGQTTLAIGVGRYLAQRHSTLYLNLESCAGMGELLPDYQSQDLADLIYYLHADPGKLSLRMKTMVHNMGGLSYFLPVKAGQALLELTAEDWMQLFSQIEMLGEYEYVVLDMGDAVNGLIEVLRLCTRIFTPVSRDTRGREKRNQYELVLEKSGCRDILRKTTWLDIPRMHLPSTLKEMPGKEMVPYMQEILEELGSEEWKR